MKNSLCTAMFIFHIVYIYTTVYFAQLGLYALALMVFATLAHVTIYAANFTSWNEHNNDE